MLGDYGGFGLQGAASASQRQYRKPNVECLATGTFFYDPSQRPLWNSWIGAAARESDCGPTRLPYGSASTPLDAKGPSKLAPGFFSRENRCEGSTLVQ